MRSLYPVLMDAVRKGRRQGGAWLKALLAQALLRCGDKRGATVLAMVHLSSGTWGSKMAVVTVGDCVAMQFRRSRPPGPYGADRLVPVNQTDPDRKTTTKRKQDGTTSTSHIPPQLQWNRFRGTGQQSSPAAEAVQQVKQAVCTSWLDVQEGDVVCLVSDGVWDCLGLPGITLALQDSINGTGPDALCPALAARALCEHAYFSNIKADDITACVGIVLSSGYSCGYRSATWPTDQELHNFRRSRWRGSKTPDAFLLGQASASGRYFNSLRADSQYFRHLFEELLLRALGFTAIFWMPPSNYKVVFLRIWIRLWLVG